MRRWFLCALSILAFAWDSPSKAGEIGRVRVLTLNIFAGTREMDFERLDRQLKAVRALGADVICLQEVYDHRVRAIYQIEFNGFDYLGHDRDTPFLSPSRWLLDWTLSPGEREIVLGFETDSALLLDTRKWQVSPGTKRSVTLPNAAPAVDSSLKLAISVLESLKPKGYVSVRSRIHGAWVRVANMRLTNGVDNPNRMLQVRQVVADLERTRGSDPVILCGDTNSDADNADMRWLRGEAGFHDSFLEANPDPSLTPHRGSTWSSDNDLTFAGNLREPDQRVDYVYYLPGRDVTFETESSRIVLDEAPFVSDHFGVLTELKLIRRR
jgi:endonuclease/exonuclease/phosphatase family metal-dependent hydrolase